MKPATNSFIHSFTYLFFHSLIHSFTHSPIHSSTKGSRILQFKIKIAWVILTPPPNPDPHKLKGDVINQRRFVLVISTLGYDYYFFSIYSNDHDNYLNHIVVITRASILQLCYLHVVFTWGLHRHLLLIDHRTKHSASPILKSTSRHCNIFRYDNKKMVHLVHDIIIFIVGLLTEVQIPFEISHSL